jgi:hypothetical protein
VAEPNMWNPRSLGLGSKNSGFKQKNKNFKTSAQVYLQKLEYFTQRKNT